MEASIIIVNWNTKEYLKRCLLSLRKQQDVDFEIYVVDNNSIDGSKEMIRGEFPGVHTISNTVNRGFAGANNQALRFAKGNVIILMNPDIELQTNYDLRRIVDASAKRNSGILGPLLLNADLSIQPSVRSLPTFFSLLLIMMKLHVLFAWLPSLKKYNCQSFNYKKPQEVQQVSGALFAISRDCLEKVGLLDERFWIWFEEVDYCKRARDAHFSVWFDPSVSVIHYGGQSFQQVIPRTRQAMFNASIRAYAKKHFSFWQYVALTLISPLSIALSYLTPHKRRLTSYAHTK